MQYGASTEFRYEREEQPLPRLGYPRETQEMVFDAHDRAFGFFKGTCTRGIYDNMKTAVETIFVGRERAYNRRFLQMCSHYLVDPVACTPASRHGPSLRHWRTKPSLIPYRLVPPPDLFANSGPGSGYGQKVVTSCGDADARRRPGRFPFLDTGGGAADLHQNRNFYVPWTLADPSAA